MKTWKKLALCAACFAAISFAMPDYADAARLGRGRSFGSSSVLSRPATPPAGIKSGASSATTGTSRRRTGFNRHILTSHALSLIWLFFSNRSNLKTNFSLGS